VPETFPGNSRNSLANTRLTDRELLIHAVQHLEHLTERLNELCEELAVYRPLLEKIAPGGRPSVTGIISARREMRGGQRVW
jgi:hypothetical protein